METTPKVAQQLDLEDMARGDGISRYRTERDRQDETELKPGMRLLRDSVLPVAVAIEADLEAAQTAARRRSPSVYTRYFAEFDPLVLAYIAARTCINMACGKESSLTRTAMMIATLLEEHKLFDDLRQAEPGLFNYVERQINNTVPERQRWAMRKATKLAEKTVKGLEWADGEKLHVGIKLIELFATHTGLVQERQIVRGKKRKLLIEPTEKMAEWLERQHDGLELLTPMHKPMVVPPVDWTNPKDGGYLTHRMDLIKANRAETIDEYFSAIMPEVYTAVNALQATAWRVNAGVARVLRVAWAEGKGLGGIPLADGAELPARPSDIPKDVPVSALNAGQKKRLNAWRAATSQVHSDNAAEKSKRLTLAMQLSVADQFADEEFYFPYQLDFRGRIYAVPPVLNPQGDNVAKALLEFAEGKPLGETGGFWLAVHIANEFGIDTVSFDERVQWVLDNEDLILDSALDPLDGARFWATADGGKNAWTALAACQEWAGFKMDGDDYVSHLPIGMDGSCSGLQHFSALLRDPVGAAAVNLLPSEEKSDIYQTVADAVEVCLNDPRLVNDPLAAAWRGKVTRKVVKQPCMTFAYSSTVHGMRDQIIAALRKSDTDLGIEAFEASMFLAPIVRECIQRTVVAASDALGWLQEVARVSTDAGEPLVWTSPVGLPVVQDKRTTVGKRVDAIYEGRRVQLQLQTESDKLNRRAQVNGISPNFVHAMDSAHLMRTVNSSTEAGITSFAMIHDSFGAHACDIDMLHMILRDEFVSIYDIDWLGSFRQEISEQLEGVDLPDQPPMGDLDIEQVRDSDFFFS